VKEVVYVGSTFKDLKKVPGRVRSVFANAIQMVAEGDTHQDAKPLKGYGGRNVVEVVSDDRGGTYRAVYTIKFKEVLYVLQVFKKKSTKGISLPKKDRELLEKRLKAAAAHHKSTTKIKRS